MAHLTAAISLLLELFSIAAGLVLLQRASKEAPAKFLQVAGWLLVVGGLLFGACTTVYWFKYRSFGEVDAGHMGHPGILHAPGRGMDPRTMERGVGEPERMAPGMTEPRGTAGGTGAAPEENMPSPTGEGAR
jgi:hypothetical protein